MFSKQSRIMKQYMNSEKLFIVLICGNISIILRAITVIIDFHHTYHHNTLQTLTIIFFDIFLHLFFISKNYLLFFVLSCLLIIFFVKQHTHNWCKYYVILKHLCYRSYSNYSSPQLQKLKHNYIITNNKFNS